MSRPRKALGDHASAWWREPDGTWRGKVAVGRRATGALVYEQPRRKTEAAVKKAIREIEKQRDARTKVWTAKDPTLAEWTIRWLDVLLPLKGRKPKTINDYRSKLGKHVLPTLGSLRLSELTVEHFQDLYAAMAATGSSQHVVHGTHRVVMSSLNAAVRAQVLVFNVAANVEVKKPVEDEVTPLSKDDARKVLAAAERVRNGARWSVALSVGLRQGEALGLRWADLDLDAGVLTVRQALGREPGRHGCGSGPGEDGRWPCGFRQGARCPQRLSGGLKVGTTKTRDSRRAIQIPVPLVAALRAQKRLQVEERLRAGDLWDDNDLVFATEFGRPTDPRADWAAWKRLLASAGVPERRLHDARHTAATLLLVMGVDSRTVMAVMGWTEQRTAKRYTHVVDELRRDAADRMTQALWADEA